MGSKWRTILLENKCERINKIDGNTTSYSMNEIKENARMRVGHDVDLVLKNRKLKNLGQPQDEVLMVNGDRLTIHKLQGKRRPHYS